MENIKYCNVGEEIECKCGNTAGDHGFQPINEKKEYVEPTPEEWNGLYLCVKCDQVYKVTN